MSFQLVFFSANICSFARVSGPQPLSSRRLGNRPYCGQQLFLQLGFLKGSKYHLPFIVPKTKQAKLPWESDLHSGSTLFPPLPSHDQGGKSYPCAPGQEQPSLGSDTMYPPTPPPPRQQQILGACLTKVFKKILCIST